MSKSKTILMIFALFMASINLRPAINSIGPLIELLQNDLHMSSSLASLLTSIPVLCMGLFSPLAAKLGGRIGIEKVIGWALALIGIGTALRLFTGSAAFLLVTAWVAGIGIAAIGPLLSGFIKRYFPNHVPGIISVYSVALTLGAALGSGLSTPLQSTMHSWQGALAVWAVLALLAIPVWCFIVWRHVEKPSGRSSAQPAAGLPWSNPRAWLLTFSFGLMAMIFYSITAWLPPIVQDMGYSKMYAGNVLTIFAFIQIPVSLLLPSLLKRYASRLFWLLLAAVIELAGFLMILFAFQPWIAAVLLGVGAAALFSINLLLPIDMAANTQEASSWSAMTQSVGYVVGAAGPVLLGFIHDRTGSFLSAVIGLIAIVLLMMAVQAAAVRSKRRMREMEAA